MTPNKILWIYIVVLVAGGLVGLLKANSKISLIMSLAFAAALALCATDIVQVPRLADIILIFLVVFFGLRFAKSKKFMPAGLMSILTAATVAARVAWERNGRLGAEVGYQIRFDDVTSLGTRICFVTEGILLRWLQDDRTLPEVGAVLFDEFHERNLLSDVALALVKQLQQTQRPELKMVVMSATLDAAPVAEYLATEGAAPVLSRRATSYGKPEGASLPTGPHLQFRAGAAPVLVS